MGVPARGSRVGSGGDRRRGAAAPAASRSHAAGALGPAPRAAGEAARGSGAPDPRPGRASQRPPRPRAAEARLLRAAQDTPRDRNRRAPSPSVIPDGHATLIGRFERHLREEYAQGKLHSDGPAKSYPRAARRFSSSSPSSAARRSVRTSGTPTSSTASCAATSKRSAPAVSRRLRASPSWHARPSTSWATSWRRPAVQGCGTSREPHPTPPWLSDRALLAVASAVDGTVIRYYGNPYEGDSRAS